MNNNTYIKKYLQNELSFENNKFNNPFYFDNFELSVDF